MATTTRDFVRDVMVEFSKITSKPEKLLESDDTLKVHLERLLKQTYDFTKQEETTPAPTALPELIVQGFDIEQIWQQLELQNADFLNNAVADVSQLVAAKNRLTFDLSTHSDDGDGFEEEEDVEEDNDVDEELDRDPEIDSNEDEPIVKKKKSKKTGAKSAVDDDFFKLDEMNKFLVGQEKPAPRKSEDNDESDSEASMDLFEATEDPVNSDDDNPKYDDFFEKDDGSDDCKNEDTVALRKSTHELRSERLQKRIEEIEDEKLNPKPWQMKGEITAEGRPENSLLEEVVEFNLTTRPAPVITEEVNHSIEDVILQRIKDKAFDDVIQKQRPVATPLEYKKKLLLDQEKSKISLAQIYENEYLNQVAAKDAVADEKEEEEPKAHAEIRKEMRALFGKLDAMANFHFTPKMASAEVRIVSNVPAISMEEVAPLAVSDAAMLAPEEVRARDRGNLIGKSEMTATDRKRNRRKKKRKQQVHAENASKSKLSEKIKSKNVKLQAPKNVKSSTAFFEQLQDEVRTQIKSKKAKRDDRKTALKATKIKL